MLYQEPDSLYKDILKNKNKQNDFNNYMDCPAFLKSTNNTFIVRNPWTTTITIDYATGKFLNQYGQEDAISEHFTPKPISRVQPLFNVYHNFLFLVKKIWKYQLFLRTCILVNFKLNVRIFREHLILPNGYAQ